MPYRKQTPKIQPHRYSTKGEITPTAAGGKKMRDVASEIAVDTNRILISGTRPLAISSTRKEPARAITPCHETWQEDALEGGFAPPSLAFQSLMECLDVGADV